MTIESHDLDEQPVTTPFWLIVGIVIGSVVMLAAGVILDMLLR